MNRTRVILMILSMAVLIFVVEASNREMAIAVETGNFAAIKALLDKDPKLANAVDANGNPVINRAVTKKNMAIVKLLIKNSGNVNAVQKDFGTTTLHAAAAYGSEEIVRLLMDKGSTLNNKGYDILYLLHAASAASEQLIVDMIVKKEKEIDFPATHRDGSVLLHSAASGGLMGFIRFLMAKNLHPDTKNIYGKTPIHLAAQGGYRDVIELFLEKEVDIDIAANDGRTPLHFARQWEKTEVVNLLVEKGAYTGPREFPKLGGAYFGQKRPGLTPEVFAPGIISSDEYGEHSYPTFSPNFRKYTGLPIPGESRKSTG